MRDQRTGSRIFKIASDERGIAFMTVMILTLMTGVLGVAALTMTGLENSMAGAVRMVEEGTHAAESCVGTAVHVINAAIDDPSMAGPAAAVVAPQGPVPALNAAFLSQEINGSLRNNADVAVGAGNAPNLTMNVNNYVINGDIDFLYSKQKTGDNLGDAEGLSINQFYRVDCTAANATTGATSRVIVVFDCLQKTGEGCTKRTGI
jgi:Tfp pilus assembly protein PilX